MTKQQTVELLKKQLPGFYSVEQVISIINGIEDGSNEFDRDRQDDLKELIAEKVSLYLNRMNGNDVADLDSAELELNGNEISVYNIDVNVDLIVDEVNDAIDDVFKVVFTPQQIETT